jgi:hypothetical protein
MSANTTIFIWGGALDIRCPRGTFGQFMDLPPSAVDCMVPWKQSRNAILGVTSTWGMLLFGGSFLGGLLLSGGIFLAGLFLYCRRDGIQDESCGNVDGMWMSIGYESIVAILGGQGQVLIRFHAKRRGLFLD